MDGTPNTQVNQLDYVKLPPSASNGPRPFRCEVCQRSFREVATLRKHEQLHRADRPYVCTTCGKSFLWSSNLKVHERVHTGERPYKCKICHRCFTQSNDLRRHERNVHMRGKLYGYRNTSVRQHSQYNLAAYQAFAMQQRALLQQAFTYENIMQNATVTQPSYVPSAQTKPCEISTSSDNQGNNSGNKSPLKLEQVTPPTTPNGSERDRRESSSSVNTIPPLTTPPHDSGYISSSAQSNYSHLSVSSHSVIHSPPPPRLIPSESTHCHVTNHRTCPESPGPPLKKRFSSGDRSPHSRSESRSMLYSPFDRDHNGSSPVQQSAANSGLPHYLPQEQTSSISSYYDGRQLSDNGMDLRVKKSAPSSIDSESETWKDFTSPSVPQTKSPSLGSESDEKRDVTTTSGTPTSDHGIHHCLHCNIVFKDYTMYHLHEALHSPNEEYPFTCPSCQKHCQDRIEFNFHIVWHVKYPHTIPNYQPFRECYLN